jgi:uncharacterized membrane protein YhaH (DUF805 family)
MKFDMVHDCPPHAQFGNGLWAAGATIPFGGHMPNQISSTYFSIKGRVSRGAFLRLWLRLSILNVLILVLGIFAVVQGYPLGGYVAGAAIVLLLLSFIPICIKRLHDRGYTGWLAILSICLAVISAFIGKAPFILFIFGLVQLWLSIETFILRGIAGGNRYGSDPLA